MKSKFLFLLILIPFCSEAQDSLRYNQWSLGLNLASLLNVSPEINSEFLFTEKISTKIDLGFRPRIAAIDLSDKLESRKIGGYFVRFGIRFYNRTQLRRRSFYSGAGIILASYKSSAKVVVPDYYGKLYRTVSASQNTYGLTANLGFQKKIAKKLLFEVGGAYTFLYNGNDTLLNNYGHLSFAQPGLGNVSFSVFSKKISNGLALNISMRYILFYRNDKERQEQGDYSR